MALDGDKAATRCSRMWFRLGKALEKQALDFAERGAGRDAIQAARRADACYWQATGEGDSITMEDIVEGTHD